MKLGYIGLGIMGAPMACNLLRAGYDLTVWNRSPEKCEPLRQEGAQVATSPAELAAAGPHVIFMNVSNTASVEAVLFGPDGLTHGLKKGQILIDNSTISPSATQRFATRLEEQGVALLDAPVSGGSAGAENATLSIMVGGDEATFKKCQPVLAVLATAVTRLGPAGSGQACKVCNQIAVACNLLGVCEALAYARQSGLPMERMLEVVTQGAGGSVQMQKNGPKIVDADMTPGFSVQLLLKDLTIARDSAGEHHLPLLGTGLVADALHSLVANGHGDCGTQALSMMLEQLGGFSFNDESFSGTGMMKAER